MVSTLVVGLALAFFLENSSRHTPSDSDDTDEKPGQRIPVWVAKLLSRAGTRQRGTDQLAEWKRPITFFGKVVDEKSNSVTHATVHFLWTDTSAKGTSEQTNFSGADGIFELKGVQGRNLGVNVSKPGYYHSTSNKTSFDYSPRSGANYHRPDPTNPVVYRLRKKGSGADLITSQRGVLRTLEVRAPRDGRPIYVDLMKRTVGDSGQLEISQIKPDYLKWREATEWILRMALPGGGFAEHSEEFPFEAPEQGYQPIMEFRFKIDEPNWTEGLGRLRKTYFISFGQPRRYGSLVVETSIEMEGARLWFLVNPHGSRYLEPDEMTRKIMRFPP